MKTDEKYSPKSFWKKKKKDGKEKADTSGQDKKTVKKPAKSGKKKKQPKLSFPSKRGSKKK